jgi:sugar lactone lactonase YvrE
MRQVSRLFCFFVLPLLVPSAALAHPGASIAVDSHGNVFFADTLRGVWKIDPAGTLTFVGPPNFHFFALDDDNLFARFNRRTVGDEIRPITGASSPTVVESSDFAVVISRGGLYFAPGAEGKPLTLVRAAPDGSLKNVATLPGLRWLNGIAAAPDGSIHGTSDTGVFRVAPSGAVTWIARNVMVQDCTSLSDLEDLPASPYLRGLAVAGDGVVYAAATGCRAVVRISSSGTVTTILKTEGDWSPTAVATAGGALYVLEYNHRAAERVWPPRVRKVDAAGKVTVLATITR